MQHWRIRSQDIWSDRAANGKYATQFEVTILRKRSAMRSQTVAQRASRVVQCEADGMTFDAMEDVDETDYERQRSPLLNQVVNGHFHGW